MKQQCPFWNNRTTPPRSLFVQLLLWTSTWTTTVFLATATTHRTTASPPLPPPAVVAGETTATTTLWNEEKDSNNNDQEDWLFRSTSKFKKENDYDNDNNNNNNHNPNVRTATITTTPTTVVEQPPQDEEEDDDDDDETPLSLTASTTPSVSSWSSSRSSSSSPLPSSSSALMVSKKPPVQDKKEMDKHDNNDSDNNNDNNNNNNDDDDDEVSIAPLFILCSVDGSIYALDAHSGALKSTSQTGPPLITRSHFKYKQDEENDDDLYDDDDDDDWEEEIQDDNQKDDQDDDDDENDNTNSDEEYENDEYDVVAAADTNDSQSSSRSDEEGARPGRRRRRRKPRKGRGDRSNDIMEQEEEEDAAAAAAMMIHPGLDGKLYWQTPIHDDDDSSSSSSSLYQLQALPVSMASLLEHPVQSCRSDNHHNHRNPGEPPQPQQCGILTASVAQNTLLALDTHTGALQWTSSSSNGGNHHNNHHSTTGTTTTTTTTTTTNPSNGRNNNNNNNKKKKNHKRRHNNNHQKNKKKKTVLLQRKDLVVQHISAASGRPLWNVTLGSYQAIDFSSSTTSSSTTTTKNRPPLPLLRFAQGGRQLVALRSSSSSSSDTAATTPPLQDNDDCNIDNNNNNKSELASLRNDNHDDAESSASSPTTTTSTPNEDDALTPDEALQVLWRIESPHVLASVFAIDEHGWKAVQVLDDEEEDDDENDDHHPVVEYQQKDGPLPRLPASPVDEGAFVQTWSSWHPPSDPQQSKPQSQQASHSWYALPGSATSQPQLVPFFSSQHPQQQEQGQCVSDGETPTTTATTTTTATITSVDDKAVVPPPQSPPQEAADIVEQIPSLPPPQENATVPSPAPPSLVLEPPGPNPLPMGPRPPYYAYPPQSMLMMTHAHNQLEHEKLMDDLDDLMQAIRWGIVVLAVVILVSWMLWMQYHQRRRCHNNSQGRHKKPAWTRRSNSTTEPRSSTSNINGNGPESSTSRPSLMESSSSALSSSLPLSFLAGMGHNGHFPPKPYLAKNRATLPLVRSSLSFPGVIPSSFHVTSTTATAPNNNHNKNMGLMGAPRRTTTDDEPKPPNAKDKVSGEIALAQENDDGDKNKNNNAQVTTATAPGVATEPDNPSPLQTSAAAVAAVIQHPTGVGTTTVPLVQYARYDSEFEELEALGRGGFGSVVRCRNKLDGRDYAIKKVTIQGGGRGGNHDNNPQAQVQQFQQELARVLREVKILAVLDHPNIVRYFTAWLEMDPDAKTKPKLKSNRRSSSGGGNKSNSSSDATPPQNTNNSSAKSLYPQRRSAIYSNKFHSSSSAAGSSSSLLWSQRVRNKWHGRNQDSSSAAWSEQNRAAVAIAASLQVNGCGIDNDNDDCGIIFEDSSAMGESGGGGGKNVLKCQTLGYYHDRSEQISESGGASSAWDDDEEDDQDRDDARMDKDRDLVDGAVPIVQHTLYIQMQLCRCDTLADFLVDKESRRGRSSRKAKGGNKNKNNKNNSKNNSNAVDIPLALSLLLQVAKAVQHVHEKGLIHRDLKPSNCFIDDDGVVKVGDFGLSRETSSARVNGNKNIDDGTAPLDDDDDGTDKETADAAIVAQLFGDDVADDNADHHVDHTAGVGTRLYASPEQTEGSSYDSSTDVYSLGIILYELCYPMYTGMERNICLSKLRQQRQFPLDWHTVVGPYYGEPIQTLVKSMLDPRPSLRPTALEVAQRIKGVMGELTILSPPRTRPPRRSKSNASDHALDHGSGSNDNEDDDDDNLLFLRVESNCQDNALQHTLSLIQSAKQEGKIKVDILQSGMAKQAHTDTTILEFAVQFRLENDDHQNNDNQVGETTSTTSSSSGWDNPQQYLVDRLEQSKEIIRVQQISVHHCHHHHHHHHHHSSASPRASD